MPNISGKVQELTVNGQPEIMCTFLNQDGEILLPIVQMWVTYPHEHPMHLKQDRKQFTTGVLRRMVATRKGEAVGPN